MSETRYFLPAGYKSRLEPAYFVDDDLNATWQPDLYAEAAGLARRLGVNRIVDVGCGTAQKLAALHPDFDLVGIDFGSNIATCLDRYVFGTWLDIDLDRSESLGTDVADSVLVCGDVIEHLVYPDNLLGLLRRGLDDGALALLLTTPDRALNNEVGHLGPPLNPAHTREWAMEELRSYMASAGLRGYFGLTRSNDLTPYMRTILSAVPGRAPFHEEVVEAWFTERAKWQEIAVQQDALIARLEQSGRDVQKAYDWAEEQRRAWQQEAEAAATTIHGLNARIEALERTARPHSVFECAEDTSTVLDPDSRPLVTVVTDIHRHEPSDGSATALASVAASLELQTLAASEWRVVVREGDSIDVREIPGTHVIRAASRAAGVAKAVEEPAEFVAVVEPGESLDPTVLEKWAWFLAAHPGCMSVHSTAETKRGALPRALMMRREVLEQAGTLDVARGHVHRMPSGFVPIPERPDQGFLARSPEYVPSANEWLPRLTPFRNLRPKAGRRLLLVCPFMTVGGADRFNLSLIRELSTAGWQVTVATTNHGPYDWYARYRELTRDVFPMPHFLRLIDQPRFLKYLIESRQPDAILVSNSEVGYRLLPFLRSVTPGTALVDYCHSLAEGWNNGGYPRFSVEYNEFLDLTITTSESLRDWLIARGADADRVEVSYACADVGAPSVESRKRVRTSLGIAHGEHVILVVGRVSEDKQPEVVGETFAALERDGVPFTAIVAGDGPDLPWLRSFIARRVRSRVLLLGDVEPERVASLMGASDLFFLPSRSEGIALTIFEAMACGLPIVGARVGGQAELVSSDCGILIDRSTVSEEVEAYASAVGGLLRDAGKRAAMAAAGRRRIEAAFTPAKMGERMNELLERAVAGSRTAPRPRPTLRAGMMSATETMEIVRLQGLVEQWWQRFDGRDQSPAGLGFHGYRLARRFGAPLYRAGVARGWEWLPDLRDRVRRSAGLP